MVQHTHEKHVDGCFRCDLSRDEVALEVCFTCPRCRAFVMTSKHTVAHRCRSCNVWMEKDKDVEHDDECGDEIRYSGACKHYTPGGKA